MSDNKMDWKVKAGIAFTILVIIIVYLLNYKIINSYISSLFSTTNTKKEINNEIIDENKKEEIFIRNVSDKINSNAYRLSFEVLGVNDGYEQSLSLYGDDMKNTYSNVLPNVRVSNEKIIFRFTEDNGNTVIEKEYSIPSNTWIEVNIIKQFRKLRILIDYKERYVYTLPNFEIPSSFIRVYGDNYNIRNTRFIGI